MQKVFFGILGEKIAGTFAETEGPESIRNAVVVKYLQRDFCAYHRVSEIRILFSLKMSQCSLYVPHLNIIKHRVKNLAL